MNFGGYDQRVELECNLDMVIRSRQKCPVFQCKDSKAHRCINPMAKKVVLAKMVALIFMSSRIRKVINFFGIRFVSEFQSDSANRNFLLARARGMISSQECRVELSVFSRGKIANDPHFL